MNLSEITDIEEFVGQYELSRKSKKLRKILRNEYTRNYYLLNREKRIESVKKYIAKRRDYYNQIWKRRSEKIKVKKIQELRKRKTLKRQKHISDLLKYELEKCKLWHDKCPRATVTPQKLRTILLTIMRQRIEEYKNPTPLGTKKKILCIVGESGTGKTLASLHLKYKKDANVICSFTTRPPRPTEEEGRDHHFISIHPQENDVLAMTKYGGYLYYALKSQVFGDCTVYVIDENGLRDLLDVHSEEYRIFTVYLKRDMALRKKCKVKKDRIKRDAEREGFPLDFYDYVIENNTTKAHLFESIEKIYNTIKNME